MVNINEIEQLTTEEKVHLLIGKTSFGSFPVERLGIPRIQYLDGGTGLNWEQLMGDWMNVDTGTARTVLSHFNEPEHLSDNLKQIRSTFIKLLQEHDYPSTSSKEYIPAQPGCYPSGILLGATWNPDVVYECGKALGEEASVCHIDILLGTPNVNLHRDPLNGRLFEGYSEDPYLIAALAPRLVQGVQESGVLANVKHFAANNLETYRQGIDEHISERVLRELYLPGFQACVEGGHVKTLMTSYNKINGIPSTENQWLIQEILRKEWGFGDGLVISDWGAVYDQPAAIAAGNDVDMPGPRSADAILAALERGTLSMDALNTAVSHMLKAIENAPAGKQQQDVCRKHFKETFRSSESFSVVSQEMLQAHRQAAYRCITEGAVLLKNRNQTLPIPKNSRIACIGNDTIHFHDCGDGSARVYTNQTSCLHDFMSYDYYPSADAADLSGTKYVIYSVYVQGQEGTDRKNLELGEAQQAEIRQLIKKAKCHDSRIVLLLNVCGPVDLRFCEQDVDAILCIFFSGMEGGHGVADLLTGVVNPSGKLPLTFPKRYEDCPTYLNPPSPDWTLNYGEGLYVGYRYYDKKGIEPMYPFGFGLSYTTFSLDNIQCQGSAAYELSDTDTLEPYKMTELPSTQASKKSSNKTAGFHISCRVTNTGSCAGQEVVQVYIQDVVSTLDKPVRELKGFQKVYLEPKESKTLDFYLPPSSFASFDPACKMWAVEAGCYQIYLGTSSVDLNPPVTVTITGHSCYDFGKDTPFIRIIQDSTAYSKLLEYAGSIGISESDFQGFAIYTPYFPLEQVLTSVFGWKWKGEELKQRKKEAYRILMHSSSS